VRALAIEARLTMRLITLLNRCHPVRGFVYTGARFSPDRTAIEVHVRPRRGSAARCSGCQQLAPGYDHLAERRFEFIPVWGFRVFLLYRMRRVQCKTCGIVVEAVPWANGKHHLTNAYMQFLAHWARRLSWQETADVFRTSWAVASCPNVNSAMNSSDDQFSKPCDTPMLKNLLCSFGLSISPTILENRIRVPCSGTSCSRVRSIV